MRKYDYTKINTLEKAYAKHPDKIDLQKIIKALKSLPARFSRGMIATLNAQVVTEVINNNDPAVAPFDPNYNNLKQDKWGPWCIGGDSSGSGFRFGDGGWTGTLSDANGGARLALRDQPRLQHMKKCFPDVYKEFFLMLK